MVCYKSLLLFISISFCLCAEEIQFTVSKLGESLLSCMSFSGQYTFDIEGEFSGETSIFDEIYVDLMLPTNAQAKCSPYEKTAYSSAKLHCIIDICLYPLVLTDVKLPLTPPNSGKYKINKWEEVIGAKDGESNVVEKSAKCLPEESNTFVPTSLTSNGCSGTKNTFSIIGDWENQEKLPTLNFDFKIRIDNDNQDIAECKLSTKNVKQFDCSFDGEGDIKFEEKYFQGLMTAYKMGKIETSIHVDKCSDSDSTPKSKSKSNILFLNIFLLSLAVLLLF